jgi:hypothetical protein
MQPTIGFADENNGFAGVCSHRLRRWEHRLRRWMQSAIGFAEENTGYADVPPNKSLPTGLEGIALPPPADVRYPNSRHYRRGREVIGCSHRWVLYWLSTTDIHLVRGSHKYRWKRSSEYLKELAVVLK